MGQAYYCRQCGNRLYPPETAASVRCPKCGADNRLRTAGRGDPLAALTEAPAVAVADGGTLADDGKDNAAEHGDSALPDFRETNPFADSDQRQLGATHLAISQQLNPYASPSEVPSSLDDDFLPASARVGLPWQQDHSLYSWFTTALRVAFTPSIAFRQMKVDDAYTEGVSFAVYGVLGGWFLAIGGLTCLMLMTLGPSRNVAPLVGGLAINLICGGVGAAIGAALGVLVWSALFHTGLSLMNANRHGFGTTMLVVGFSQGAMLCALPVMMIPFVSIIPSIWSMVVLVIGLREAHQTTTGKATLAVVLPSVACGIALSAVFMYRFGVGPFDIPPR